MDGIRSSTAVHFMRENGFSSTSTVREFLASKKNYTSTRNGLSLPQLEYLHKSLTWSTASPPVSLDVLLKYRSCNQFKLSTGSSSIDNILGGGLFSHELTEITGANGTGKTQCCLSVASLTLTSKTTMHSSSIMPNVSNVASSVIYIDAGSGFSPSRLYEMIVANGGDSTENMESILNNLRYVCISDVYDLFDTLENIRQAFMTGEDLFMYGLRLVILDSFSMIATSLIGGHSVHGHALLSRLASAMRSLAVDCGIVVMYTNHIVAQRDYTISTSNALNGVKPALGVAWSYVPSVRLLLSGNIYYERRTAVLLRSNRQSRNLVSNFRIADSGLLNVE